MTDRFSLDGDWQLAYFLEGEQTIDHPDDLAQAEIPAIPARVPGNVEIDLERAGVIPDPFYATNMRKLRRFEFYQWWYTREFTLPASAAGQRWILVFAGLDTIATVWVNGVEVARSSNMLIEHRCDVTEHLKPGAVNRIAVRINSAVNFARWFHYDAVVVGPEHRDEMIAVRKAAHMGGWDVLPELVDADE